MRRGVLLTGGRVREPGGPIRVRTLRLVSLSERTLGLQVSELQIEQGRGRHVRIRVDQAQQRLEAMLEAGEPMPLAVSGNRYELRLGEMVVCRISGTRAPIGSSNASTASSPVESASLG
jgi:hypothetical protein